MNSEYFIYAQDEGLGTYNYQIIVVIIIISLCIIVQPRIRRTLKCTYIIRWEDRREKNVFFNEIELFECFQRVKNTQLFHYVIGDESMNEFCMRNGIRAGQGKAGVMC